MTSPIGTEAVGNVMPAPGTRRIASTTDDEILYSYEGGFTQKGVTLAPGQGVLAAGTVLGRVTATKLWVIYKSGAGDGSQVARGVLRTGVNTGTDTSVTAQRYLGNIVITGILRNSKLSGADATAITSLGARVDAVMDTFRF